MDEPEPRECVPFDLSDTESAFEEYQRDLNQMSEDLASDAEDFARSGEDGWFYSDEE